MYKCSDRDKRFNIPLVRLLSGIVLAGAYMIAQELLPQFYGGELERFLTWVMSVTGILVPLTILLADKYTPSCFSAGRKQ